MTKWSKNPPNRRYGVPALMSTIRIEDISHVRFSAPDLDEMERFLASFGLTPFRDGQGRLYGRGTGGAPFLHMTGEGPAGFVALGLRAESPEALEVLAQAEGARVEPLSTPGGGSMVRLTDPDGFCIEVVAGQAPFPGEPPAPEAVRNTAAARPRISSRVRVEAGPSRVVRLGHAVLEVSDFRASEAWYKSRFGLLTSDEIEAAPDFAIGAFLRCDRGDRPTDHHTLFLLQGPGGPRYNHAAFEVESLDDLMRGHAHLKGDGRTAAWGVGRHILGSQVFDYWKDPWGNEVEHWTDGDLFTASEPPGKATVADLLGVQWGAVHPMMAQGGR